MSTDTSIHRPLWPDPLATLEDAERFVHVDLETLDPLRAWAEAHLLEHALAEMVFRRQRGPCLAIVDGAPVYAVTWAHDRLARLRRKLRRSAA